MKPNGRRAWRRFAKQQRRKVNRRNRQTGEPWINDADGAFYRHEQKHFAQRPTLPARPFTARSLVGMTMGARKRRWAKDYDALPQFGRFAKTMSMLRAYGVYPKEGNPLAQRLRPCPGCCSCGPCFGPKPCRRVCDGSGVLPKRVRAKRL